MPLAPESAEGLATAQLSIKSSKQAMYKTYNDVFSLHTRELDLKSLSV